MVNTQKKLFSEILVEKGLITAEQLRQAELERKASPKSLRKIFTEKGLINEEDIIAFLSQQYNLPFIDLANYLIDPEIIDLIPEDLAKKHLIIPILKIGNDLTVAMIDPSDVFALDELHMKTGLNIEPALATETEVKKALDQHYSAKGTLEEVISSLDRKKLEIKPEQETEIKTLEVIAEEPPVIKLVNIIIIEAVRKKASDIHIEPEEDTLKIRFRIDGLLHKQNGPPKYLQSAIVSRIKIMSNMDISERRIPQDGRIQMKIEGREIDIRVSC